MRHESAKYLYDVQEAAARVIEFTGGCDFARYAADALLRSAVERQLEIIGEALAQLARRDPALAAPISEHARIIAFRNILIYGDSEVDSRIVWDVVTTRFGTLRAEVQALLKELAP
jgi:uncharacterized protein with HEPN domain